MFETRTQRAISSPPADPMTPGAYWRNEADRARREADAAIDAAVRSQRVYARLCRSFWWVYPAVYGAGLLSGFLIACGALGLIGGVR